MSDWTEGTADLLLGPSILPSVPGNTLPQLADPEGYRASTWDLLAQPEYREYWLDLFRWHIDKMADEAVRNAGKLGHDMAHARQRADTMVAECREYLDDLTRDPACYGPLDILTICWERERAARRNGFDDAYKSAKTEQNEAALLVLPNLLVQLDAMPEEQRRAELIRGIFAGNIFDLGATDTLERFKDGPVDFHDTVAQLKPRPWFNDSLDAWTARLARKPYEHVLAFVDNAGPDITLGMVPFTRELLRNGANVILTANTTAALNDITHEELGELLEQIAALDPVIRNALVDGRLRTIASGNGAPLIDLTRLSPQLVDAAAAEPIDLVVIEGMGRAVETNLDARLSCDCLKIAMLKDKGVAEALGANLYDLLMKFEPAAE